jgi:pimeloyl-ACP methyl ester carboxylesterase
VRTYSPLLALAGLILGVSTEAQGPSDSVAMTQFRVEVAPGESLRVTVAGVAGEPVVLIPGLFGSAFGYRHLLAALPAAGHRAIVIEPLGIGGSPRPRKANYSLTAQADRLANALEHVAAGPVVVVAHAVGVSMALRLAHRHPELVKALISLEGGPAEAAATPGFRRAMRYVPWLKWLGGMKRLRPKIREGLVAASGDASWVTDDVVTGYTEGPAADLDGTLLAFLAMAAAREPEPIAPHLSEIRCPVRLLVGTAPHQGGIPDREVALLRERLPAFTVDSVEGAGQYLFEERPAAVLAVIESVMQSLPPAVGLAR